MRIDNRQPGRQQYSGCGRQTQQGFTLVELVVTIILLGILSAVAVPRFFSVSSEANIAVLESMGGAILAASSQVYARSLMAGVQSEATANVDLDGDGSNDVQVRYGYPSGSRNNGVSKIIGGGFATEWTWSTSYGDGTFWLTTAALGGRSGVYVNQTAVRNSGCYILYVPAAAAGAMPTVSYVTTDC
ncbi:MAG: type II secretion system protein [Pseudomonadales bacterium]